MKTFHRWFASLVPWPAAPDALFRVLIAAVVLAAPGTAFAQTPRWPVAPQAATAEPRVEVVAEGLVNPWGLAFLPDGRMLVTERPGRLRIVGKSGELSEPLEGLPEIAAWGQGGLLDIAISPAFKRNRLVFFSYAEPATDGARTAVARALFAETRLIDVQVIFRQKPVSTGGNHFGSRLVFGRDGNLWITLGDRYVGRDSAQRLDSHLGKVVRIRPDGTTPPDNPYRQVPGALPEIWSIGHRNMQGAALHPVTGRLWTHEHGAQGGDEVNVDLPGRNYGWPVITWGVDYGGAPIGEGTQKGGMEQPLHYWVPSIAPSGMAFYTGDRYPGWRGSLLVGSLSHTMLVRLELDGEKVVREERLLKDMRQRIRDVRQGPDGFVYLLTDEGSGRLLRLLP